MRILYTPARAFALALLVGVATLLSAPAPAQAHPVDDWYASARWPAETVQEFSYQSNFPTGAFRTAATAGVDEWNTNGNQWTPEFHPTLPDSDLTQYANPCDNPHSAVFWEDEGQTNILGTAWRCVVAGGPFGNEVARFSVRINSFYTYYAGTGVPPAGEYDLTALVAHEFGHVTAGWSPWHWNQGPDAEPTFCLLNPDKYTMCSSLSSGVVWQRQIRDHEIHTFQDAYQEPVPACEVDYTITSTWPGNVQVELVVHNNTPFWFNSGNNWMAEWTFTGDEAVSGSWGTIVSQVGQDATAVGDGFGAMVPPGGSVAVGFQATVSGTPTVPSPTACSVV